VVGGTKRTWVGGEADYLGAGKAVAVVALRTNEEGRDIGGRDIPPPLEAGDVYVLESDVICYSVSEG
jgi:hypothetical protein